MIGSKKVVVVMPAYNAEKTLKQTYDEIPFDIVDEVILTDDCSKDNTVEEAGRLGIKEVLVHERNKGYGGNQKNLLQPGVGIGCTTLSSCCTPIINILPNLSHLWPML